MFPVKHGVTAIIVGFIRHFVKISAAVVVAKISVGVIHFKIAENVVVDFVFYLVCDVKFFG